jgi:hypothetical protein
MKNKFFKYLAGLPAYVWYTIGGAVVSRIFPKGFDIWFAAELQMIQDIELYLEDKERLLHKQLAEKDRIAEDLSNENNHLREIVGMYPTAIEANSSASQEGEIKGQGRPFDWLTPAVKEEQLIDLVKVTQHIMLMYMKLNGHKLPRIKKEKMPSLKAKKPKRSKSHGTSKKH